MLYIYVQCTCTTYSYTFNITALSKCFDGNKKWDLFHYSLFHKTLPKSSLHNAVDLGKVLWNGPYLPYRFFILCFKLIFSANPISSKMCTSIFLKLSDQTGSLARNRWRWGFLWKLFLRKDMVIFMSNLESTLMKKVMLHKVFISS